ncbi:MAG TPA: universal stress protein [Bacteroidia bacterium]|nr:universal stress protein [Bacteroidia bacterium]
MSYSNILIAVDSSEYSLTAAKKGIELALQLHAKIALVFVVDKSKATGNIDAGIMPEEALIVLKKEAEQTLDELVEMGDEKNVLKFMPEGYPAEEILKTGSIWQADLIVIGTHGRTGVKHLLMGSVAEYVVRHAKTPVMVVPMK